MRADIIFDKRITTSAPLAGALLESVITPYLARYPDVFVELDTSARRVDLAREGFDLAIRVGPLDDSSLVARRFGTATGGYYASPRTLDRRGVPARLEEFGHHETIVHAVFPPGGTLVPKTRVFLDMLAAWFTRNGSCA
ncbi:LysR substrate-binding domain-containing protein [Sorangium sp. So ce726]|uniref:LysR substrate-binding domain-containing protein n=1 Tax=Sorangium sp. So ce726 TaxID=3133319 RepID=UPI003F6373D8